LIEAFLGEGITVTSADDFAEQLSYLEDYLEEALGEVKSLRKTIEGTRRHRKRQPNDKALDIHWGGVPLKKVFQRFALLGTQHGVFSKIQRDYKELLGNLKQAKSDFGVR